MHTWVVFALIAASAFGVWTLFHQLASDKINYLFGAILISFTAVIIGLIFLLPNIKTIKLRSNPKWIFFAIIAWVCALAIDYFALKAYSSGADVSIIWPIIMWWSIAIAAFIWFFMWESITSRKILGLVLIIIGSSVLATIS